MLFAAIIRFVKSPGGHIHADLRQLLLQLIEIPIRDLSGFIVYKPKRPDLLVGQIFGIQTRNLVQAELLRRLEPGVAANHNVFLVEDNRVPKTEFLDGSGYGINRCVVVSRIIRIGDNIP